MVCGASRHKPSPKTSVFLHISKKHQEFQHPLFLFARVTIIRFMFDDTISFDLLSRGRAAAKSGEKAEAVRYLERCLAQDAASDVRMEALYWLSEASDDLKVKRDCLEEILANNLGDARARRKLALLDGKLKVEEIVDPDHIPAPPMRSAPEAVAQAFICPKCGGRRVFAPDGQTLVCEYCEQQEKVSHKTVFAGGGGRLSGRHGDRQSAAQTGFGAFDPLYWLWIHLFPPARGDHSHLSLLRHALCHLAG